LTKHFTQAIKDLKESYPKVIQICDNWQLIAQNHGIQQSKEERKLLKKFSDAMKIIVEGEESS